MVWLILLLTLLATPVQAQLWSSVLTQSRAADWTVAGVTGGIQNRNTICPFYSGSPAPLPTSSTVAQINAALAACDNDGSSGGYVIPLAAGTFTLTSAVTFDPNGTNVVSYVTLRGIS